MEPKQSGTVKFYNPTKGFGFIYSEKDRKDIFFHITGINGANPPNTGERVSFHIKEIKGKKTAIDIDISSVAPLVNPKASVKNTSKILQGFPCISGETVNGFKLNHVIKKIRTRGFGTVDEAKEELVKLAKGSGANAVFNYIYHRESDWSDDYVLIFINLGRSRKTWFWAEGSAVKATKNKSPSTPKALA